MDTINKKVTSLDTIRVELINCILRMEDYEKLVALKKRADFLASFGSWQSEESSEELVENLRKDRYFRDKDINFD